MPTSTTPTLPAHLDLSTRHEAAAFARCSVSTIDRWIAAEEVPVVRFGARVLIRRSALLAYVGTAGPAPDAPLDPDVLVTIPEAARVLRLALSTVKRLPADVLPPVRFGRSVRVRLVDLSALIDSHSVPASTGALSGRLA